MQMGQVKTKQRYQEYWSGPCNRAFIVISTGTGSFVVVFYNGNKESENMEKLRKT